MPNQSWMQVLVESQASGSAVTGTSETSALPAAAKLTLPTNFFDRVGKAIQIRAFGKISSVITTPGVAQWRVKFGSTAVFDGGQIILDSVAAHTDVGWQLIIDLWASTIGASAALTGVGRWISEDILGVPATAPKGVLTAFLPWNTAPVAGSTFDSTATQQVDLTFDQSVATGSMTLMGYQLISMN